MGAELLLAVGAVGGAIGLIVGWIDLGTAVDDLPWQSPVLGGLALLVLNGLLPLVVVAGTWKRAGWAPIGHVLVGVVLVGWIVVQVAFIGFGSWLQVAYAVLGVLIAAVGLWRLAGVRAVGMVAVMSSMIYVSSDLVEVLQGGFSDVQLGLTLVAEAAIPFVVLGLAAAQRPTFEWWGWVAAAAYAYSYVFFTGTVVYAWTDDIEDYAQLTDELGTAMLVHGAVMVLAGLTFGLATLRANRLPRWPAVALMVGVVLVAATQSAPDPIPLVAATVRAVGLAGLGADLLAAPPVSRTQRRLST